MKVLVCGGRDFSDWRTLQRVLSGLRDTRGIDLVISGGASGADDLAVRWAHHERIPACIFPANWRFEGRAAGPRRNQRMLDLGSPDFLVAFPGGRGTQDMIDRAIASGVETMVV